MSDLPNLVWLRAFEASARLRSFTAAAHELGLSQAAVSHQIRSLESSFGVALFLRRARHLELTALGHAYYPSIAQALDDIAYSTRGLLRPMEARTITLRAPISTAVLWIAPRLGSFQDRHPQIKLRLISAIWADSTSDEDVDIDLRLGPSSWFDRRAHLLATESVLPVATPDVAARLGSAQQLLEQNLIHIHGYQDNWLRFAKSQGLEPQDRGAGLLTDTSLAAIEMAAAGSGVAMIMRRYAQAPLDQGRIARVMDFEMPMGQGHYLMPTTGSDPNSPEERLVRDWITEIFS
ncbi:LysR substrate-binding domain-containing protein [Parasedimentitalea psychrophila]|uniref:LysR substrate-binding domain-containing protein n=1 Tax=Parasedimentitalea psychrophila TaxID=2997337 RepID=A0A9Y2KWG9_9RHOB|nr:LysR substrate-binding domain-containing protein [Parasedimentitalea psychrophila]WIY23813.1 LysR substrate-binding domain-containing protein [Parasedimentitalea psychrophila]